MQRARSGREVPLDAPAFVSAYDSLFGSAAYARDLRAFLTAYSDLVGAVRKAAEGLYDRGLSIDTSLDLLPPEAQHLVARTAEAAGRAHSALMGGYEMEHLGRRFNPVLDWRTSFARAGTTPDMIQSRPTARRQVRTGRSRST